MFNIATSPQTGYVLIRQCEADGWRWRGKQRWPPGQANWGSYPWNVPGPFDCTSHHSLTQRYILSSTRKTLAKDTMPSAQEHQIDICAIIQCTCSQKSRAADALCQRGLWRESMVSILQPAASDSPHAASLGLTWGQTSYLLLSAGFSLCWTHRTHRSCLWSVKSTSGVPLG